MPSSPVMKIRYKSWFVLPHLERLSDVKLYGRIGWSLLSVSVEADGPSPRPSCPWHFQHSSFWKSSPPCLMLSTVSFGSAGIWIGSPGFSVTQRAENVLMNATRLARFLSGESDPTRHVREVESALQRVVKITVQRQCARRRRPALEYCCHKVSRLGVHVRRVFAVSVSRVLRGIPSSSDNTT